MVRAYKMTRIAELADGTRTLSEIASQIGSTYRATAVMMHRMRRRGYKLYLRLEPPTNKKKEPTE